MADSDIDMAKVTDILHYTLRRFRFVPVNSTIDYPVSIDSDMSTIYDFLHMLSRNIGFAVTMQSNRFVPMLLSAPRAGVSVRALAAALVAEYHDKCVRVGLNIKRR